MSGEQMCGVVILDGDIIELETEGGVLRVDMPAVESVPQLDPKIAAVEEVRELLIKITAVLDARDPRPAAYKAMGGLYCMRDVSLQDNHTVRFSVRWDVEAARDMCVALAKSLLDGADSLNGALSKHQFLKGA